MKCILRPDRNCKIDILPEYLTLQEWEEERCRNYKLSEAVSNGCRAFSDEQKEKVVLTCPECKTGRLIDGTHRNGTGGIPKIQYSCSQCSHHGYRFE